MLQDLSTCAHLYNIYILYIYSHGTDLQRIKLSLLPFTRFLLHIFSYILHGNSIFNFQYSKISLNVSLNNFPYTQGDFEYKGKKRQVPAPPRHW